MGTAQKETKKPPAQAKGAAVKAKAAVKAAPAAAAKKPAAAGAAAAAAKPAAAKAKAPAKASAKDDELDEIFSKAKKVAKAEPAADDEKTKATAPPKVQGSKDDIFGDDTGKKRKRTEEGFVIYGEDELGLTKKGGDTDLCPFDCDCCF